MKVCSKCKKTKTYSEFHKRKAEKDGYNYTCKVCVNSQKRKYYLKTQDAHKERAKEWKQNNPKKAKDIQKKASEKYYRNNQEKAKKASEKYRKANLERGAYHTAKRRAQKKKRNLGMYENELKEIYKNCPDGHHVDHIVPLNGENVSGLHVPWNLQYLTADENRRKSNKF